MPCHAMFTSVWAQCQSAAALICWFTSNSSTGRCGMTFDAGMLNILLHWLGPVWPGNVQAIYRGHIPSTGQHIGMRMKASKRCHFWFGIQWVDRFRNPRNAQVDFDGRLIEQMKQNGVQVGYHIITCMYVAYLWVHFSTWCHYTCSESGWGMELRTYTVLYNTQVQLYRKPMSLTTKCLKLIEHRPSYVHVHI